MATESVKGRQQWAQEVGGPGFEYWPLHLPAVGASASYYLYLNFTYIS